MALMNYSWGRVLVRTRGHRSERNSVDKHSFGGGGQRLLSTRNWLGEVEDYCHTVPGFIQP